jgi:hypothetical protein
MYQSQQIVTKKHLIPQGIFHPFNRHVSVAARIGKSAAPAEHIQRRIHPSEIGRANTK